jgi:hypothetical protein
MLFEIPNHLNESISYITFHYVLFTAVPSVEVVEYVLLKSADCGHYNSRGSSRTDERGESYQKRHSKGGSLPSAFQITERETTHGHAHGETIHSFHVFSPIVHHR